MAFNCRSGFLSLLLSCSSWAAVWAQHSVLLNFGSNSCSSSVPAFSLIKDPLNTTPTALTNCDMSAQLPDYYNVFIAYNPANNKVYVADVRTGLRTDIWLLDMGLPSGIACPSTIPVLPTYSYSYTSNNFEFDNNGDLWSFSNYDISTGQCNIDKFDVNTGQVLASKRIQFPTGNFPTTISSGDLTILPNGRMFAVLGNGTCRLYEITNYAGGTGTATATYLRTLPKDCYGIAYLNGSLELTGMDFFNGCYYYNYDIVAGTLGAEKPFQNGQAPIDNSSITPEIGTTKRLLSASRVNSNTADLVYEIYMENMGNVVLNNVNLTEDLAAAFGNGNVSNVTVSFAPGANQANLLLNPAFNGTSVKTIFTPNQNLPNKVNLNRNYFCKVLVGCRATNLQGSTTYLNAAIASANIGGANIATAIAVADSSNNGDSTVIDPNRNGLANDLNENIPTPFNFSSLPVRFINLSGAVASNNTTINWQVATPMINAAGFTIEFSTDGRNWTSIGNISIVDAGRGNWQFVHRNVPAGNLLYRIRQTDNDGTYTYSRTLLLSNKGTSALVLYPNPANQYLGVNLGTLLPGKTTLQLLDATGRLLLNKTVTTTSEEINTAGYPDGTYLLRIVNDGVVNQTNKVIIKH